MEPLLDINIITGKQGISRHHPRRHLAEPNLYGKMLREMVTAIYEEKSTGRLTNT
jgi:hypothetical protein